MNSQFVTFWHLLKTDIIIFKKKWLANTFDNFIWIGALTIATAYVFPLLGMTEEFGAYCAIGTIVSCAVFRVFTYASTLLADLEGANVVGYYVTLPLATPLIFIKIAIGYTLNTMSAGVFVLPFIKLLLGSRLDLSHISWPKFVIAFVSIYIFFGFFSLFAAAITTHAEDTMRTWERLVFPLWYFGGFQFSWEVLYTLSPTVAQISLANPILHASELIHSAILGPDGYLNFGISLGVLWLGIGACFIIAYYRFKKRLNFV